MLIDPTHPPTSYKLLDDIMLEFTVKLRIQHLQDILEEKRKPYL